MIEYIMSEELVIELDKLDSDEPLEEHSYIYRGFLESLHKKILNTAEANKLFIEKQQKKQHGKPKFHIHQHPCFFINGGRGTGKSTLLRGIKEKLLDRQATLSHEVSIGLLAEIDPTELADGESFIVHMLSRIWERIDEVPFEGLQGTRIADARARATKCLQEMSKGLQLLAGTQDSLSKAAEASFFIEECVEQCASGTALKNKFCELLENLSDITGNDAFLVTVDDADMNFSKCSEVMEKVRQYMLSPRIIFIFAGDIKLYSLVVRGMQLKHFGERELHYDNEREKHRKELLNNLEDQYLMKLFPAANRITLINSQGLLNRAGKSLLQTEDGTQHELGKALHHYLSNIVPKEHLQMAKSLLGSMPIRSVLQLFRYWISNVPLPKEGEAEQNEMTEPDLRKISNGLRLASTQALIQHQVDYISIHEGDIHALHEGILQHIAHMGTDAECPRILPNIGATDDKLVSLYLGSEAARLLNTPARQLQYLYTIFPQLQYAIDEILASRNESEQDNRNIEKSFSEYLLEQRYYTGNIEYRQWGARCTAYMSAKSKKGSNIEKRYARGTIRLMKKPQLNKTEQEKKEKAEHLGRTSIKQGIKAMSNLITDADTEQDNVRKTLLPTFIAFYHSISTIRSDEGVSYYLSIYNIVSLMIELLETLKNIETKNERIEVIRNILTPNELGFPEYSEEITSLSTNKNDENNEDEETRSENKAEKRYDIHQSFSSFITQQIDASKRQILNSLCQKINTWSQDYTKSDTLVFPARINDIWNHFYTRCSTITEEARIKSKDLDALVQAGDLFGDYMEAFENAVQLGLPKNTARALKEFPLWEALTCLKPSAGVSGDDPLSKFRGIVNELNIGPVTHTSTVK